MIKISNTSEQIDKNDNPDCSKVIHAIVATIMAPKETCHRFHNRTSAAEEAKTIGDKQNKTYIINENTVASLYDDMN